jgi:hypothetical protein
MTATRMGLLALVALAGLLNVATGRADTIAKPAKPDPHYNEAGFFDIHVCNWPDRAPFFLTLFSTTRFAEVERVEVFRPDGRPLGELDLKRYMAVAKPGKPPKRVFMSLLPIPDDRPEGWYSSRVTFKNGKQFHARDRVEIKILPRAGGLQPPDGALNIAMPKTLRWNPVPGATHYQVYILDRWQDGKEIYRSKVINTPYLPLPADLLTPGGLYRWRVNARDVHEHPELGDFNHGSLSDYADFEIRASP